jgi:hypothetical protein
LYVPAPKQPPVQNRKLLRSFLPPGLIFYKQDAPPEQL